MTSERPGPLPVPSFPPETRFGSAWNPVSRAVAVLRARASRFGMSLEPVGTPDAAAAVIAVDAWMLACRADSLDVPVRHGRAASNALAAALTRAAGQGSVVRPVLPASLACDEWLVAAEGYQEWASGEFGPDVAREALARAASDLSAGADDERLASMAAVLDQVSDAPCY